MEELSTAEQTIREVAAQYEGKLMTRRMVEQMSGGAYTAKSLVNLDSRGLGIEGGFLVGKKICYPLGNVVDWLISKSTSH